MKRCSQSGSAHVVIIICVVVTLMAALGWVFYQNFTTNTSDRNTAPSTKNIQKKADSDSMPKKVVHLDKIGESLGVTMGVTIPEGWKKTVKSDGPRPVRGDDIAYERTAYTSPDKTMGIKIELGNTGVGGYCDPNDMSTSKIAEIKYQHLPNSKGIIYVELATKESEEVNATVDLEPINISDRKKIEDLSIGDSACHRFAYLEVNSDGSPGRMNFMAMMHPLDKDGEFAAASLADIRSNSNYEEAKNILLSIKTTIR